MSNDRLNLDLAGLSLSNPTILASGILGYSTETLQRIVEAGAGAVVTKSVGMKPRNGYANPTVVQADCGLINAMGLPNPGISVFAGEIRKAKKLNVPIIVSVYGFSAEEYAIVSTKAAESGGDAVELNVSCPHVEETGSEVGQCAKVLREVTAKVKAAVNTPVLVKLTPNVTDICDVAETAVRAGADAITVMNTIKAMAIDTETALPILSNKYGGLSGPAIKPVALKCVYDIYDSVKVPLIGCGGVRSWRDAVEFMLAGATAVQIGTAVALEGPGVFKSVARGIDAYLKKKQFRSVKEIVGLSHRK